MDRCKHRCSNRNIQVHLKWISECDLFSHLIFVVYSGFDILGYRCRQLFLKTQIVFICMKKQGYLHKVASMFAFNILF